MGQSMVCSCFLFTKHDKADNATFKRRNTRWYEYVAPPLPLPCPPPPRPDPPTATLPPVAPTPPSLSVPPVVTCLHVPAKTTRCKTKALVVIGDGDFSFGSQLAVCWGNAKRFATYGRLIVTTPLKSKAFKTLYASGQSNHDVIQRHGMQVVYGVDIIKKPGKFWNSVDTSGLIWNFPYHDNHAHQSHKRLVQVFFTLAHQRKCVEVYLTLYVHQFEQWDVNEIGHESGYVLSEYLPYSSLKDTEPCFNYPRRCGTADVAWTSHARAHLYKWVPLKPC